MLTCCCIDAILLGLAANAIFAAGVAFGAPVIAIELVVLVWSAKLCVLLLWCVLPQAWQTKLKDGAGKFWGWARGGEGGPGEVWKHLAQGVEGVLCVLERALDGLEQRMRAMRVAVAGVKTRVQQWAGVDAATTDNPPPPPPPPAALTEILVAPAPPTETPASAPADEAPVAVAPAAAALVAAREEERREEERRQETRDRDGDEEEQPWHDAQEYPSAPADSLRAGGGAVLTAMATAEMGGAEAEAESGRAAAEAD